MRFIECLGICHTVISDDKEAKGHKFKVYNASSPDELALVNGMRHLGFAFYDRDIDDNIIVDLTRTGK
jgi:magnesium-transporting ATPase (P-type)